MEFCIEGNEPESYFNEEFDDNLMVFEFNDEKIYMVDDFLAGEFKGSKMKVKENNINVYDFLKEKEEEGKRFLLRFLLHPSLILLLFLLSLLLHFRLLLSSLLILSTLFRPPPPFHPFLQLLLPPPPPFHLPPSLFFLVNIPFTSSSSSYFEI